MKRVFLLAALFSFAFATKAQELSFEETVKYISQKFSGASEEYQVQYKDGDGKWTYSNVEKIDINKEGDITITLSYFSAPVIKFNLFKIATKSEGVLKDQTEVHIVESKNRICSFSTPSILDAERLYKALIHLRSLCTKVKDPFDN